MAKAAFYFSFFFFMLPSVLSFFGVPFIDDRDSHEMRMVWVGWMVYTGMLMLKDEIRDHKKSRQRKEE